MSIQSAAALRGKTAQRPWFQAAAAQLREETDAILALGLEVPKHPGGWWHQYVCPTHGTELLFDPCEQDAHQFRCSHGCVLTGDEYRGAWLVFKHQERARTALSAAALYAVTGEASYAAAANAILEAYAVQYPLYPVHPDAQPWMLKGRAFHQALTEAIWSTTLIKAYLLLKDAGVLEKEAAAKLDAFFSLLEGSMAEYRRILIHERNEPGNNYTAWLNACLACIYAARGEREAMEQLAADRGGPLHHLSIGVFADQMEFEGSPYYHLFVLRAYWIAVEMAERLGLNAGDWTGEQGQSCRGMLEAICGLSAPNGEIPAIHDGPYQRAPFAREVAEVFEIGYARYGDPRFVPILREAYRQIGAAPIERYGLEAVLYGDGNWMEGASTHPSEPSRLYEQAGFVVLRHPANSLSMFADYGPHGGSHGHDDKLNLVLMHENGIVLPDRGMVPYGSSLRRPWFARTQSHNTVSIGGQTQAEHEGVCVRYDTSSENYAYAWLRSEGAYEGAVLDRHLWINGDIALDWFEVQLTEPDTIEAWLHVLEGVEALDAADWEACPHDAVTGAGSAYEYIRTKARWRGDGRIAGMGTKCGGAPIRVAASVAADAELYRITSPGTSVDPSAALDGLVQRVRGNRAVFITAFAAGAGTLRLEQQEEHRITVSIDDTNISLRMTEQGLRKE